jgi:uncharacterized membrane protein
MTIRYEESLHHGFNVPVGKYISDGWKVLEQNFGAYIGFLVISLLIQIIASCIPFATFIIAPCFTAGYYIVSKKIYSGETTEFGDFFKGFDFIGQLILMTIINVAIFMVVFVPTYFVIIFGSWGGLVSSRPSTFLTVFIIAMVLIMFCGFIYLVVSYIFAEHFIIFHKMEAWNAMEASRKLVGKNWVGIFGLGLALLGVQIIGALFCFLGLLVTTPLVYCTIHCAFQDIVGIEDDLIQAIEEMGKTKPNLYDGEEEY